MQKQENWLAGLTLENLGNQSVKVQDFTIYN